jgi:hypothetical protein
MVHCRTSLYAVACAADVKWVDTCLVAYWRIYVLNILFLRVILLFCESFLVPLLELFLSFRGFFNFSKQTDSD